MTDENLTMDEKDALFNYLNNQGSPAPEEKYNVHLFLHRVATASDTTKIGFLGDNEVGIPQYPTRALKTFAIIASDIIGNEHIANYFNKESEIVTSTSLSKQGFLVKQATTQTRHIGDVTKLRKKNKGWFSKKEDNEDKKEEE